MLWCIMQGEISAQIVLQQTLVILSQNREHQMCVQIVCDKLDTSKIQYWNS